MNDVTRLIYRNALFALVLFSAAAQANTIVVTDTGGSIDDNGLCSINEAVANATGISSNFAFFADCAPGQAEPDTIQLTTDVTLDGPAPLTTIRGVFLIESAITIDGQGHVLRRSPALDCTRDGVHQAEEFRLLQVEAPDGDLRLKNITLENGCADGGGTSKDGAAVFNNGGQLAVANSVLAMNEAYGDGGAIFNNGTITEISDSVLSGNRADESGGGIRNEASIVTISNSTFSGNGAGGYGGGIGNIGTITAIANSTLFGNGADISGGIGNIGTITTIINSTFSDNTGGTGPGAIGNSGSITTIANSTFAENSGFGIGAIGNIGGLIGNLTNAILTNNIETTGTSEADCSNSGTFEGSNNLVDDPITDCPGRIATVANIDATLRDNGCISPGPDGTCVGTYALKPGSNAAEGAIDGTPADQRGFAASGARDIGAYELYDPGAAPVPLLETGKYLPGGFGNGFGSNQHFDVFAAVFPSDGREDRLLDLRAWDVDGNNELGVWVNGAPFGLLRRGPNEGLARPSAFWIPKKYLVAGQNRVEVRQRKAGNEPWGVEQVGLFRPGVVWGNVRRNQHFHDALHKEGFDLHLKGKKPKLLGVRGWDNNKTEAKVAEIEFKRRNNILGRLPRSGATKLGKPYQVYLPGKKLRNDNIVLIHNAIDPEGNWGVQLRQLNKGKAKAGRLKGALKGTKKKVRYLIPVDEMTDREVELQFNDVDLPGEVKIKVGDKRKKNAPASENKKWVSDSMTLKGSEMPKLIKITVETTKKKDRWGSRITNWK